MSAVAVAVASARAVVTFTGTGLEVMMWGRGATVAIRNTSDITHFSTSKYELFEEFVVSQ